MPANCPLAALAPREIAVVASHPPGGLIFNFGLRMACMRETLPSFEAAEPVEAAEP
jgi:hypothetical protein